MTVTAKPKYGAIAQPITITLDGLADGGLRESTAISNTVNRFDEIKISGIAEAAATLADGTLNVYAYAKNDTGKYTGSATGVDAAYGAVAGQNLNNCPLIGSVTLDAATTEEFEWGPLSLEEAFGFVPEEWGIIVEWIDNDVGIALFSDSNVANYQGLNTESV